MVVIRNSTPSNEVADQEFGGETGIGITVNYANGQKEMVDPMRSNILSVFNNPLTIQTDKGEVTSLDFSVSVKPTWLGGPEEGTASGAFKILVDGTAQEEHTVSSISVANGVLTSILTTSVSGDTIESWSPTSGAKILSLLADISVSVDFPNGTQTKTGSAVGSWDYEVPAVVPESDPVDVTTIGTVTIYVPPSRYPDNTWDVYGYVYSTDTVLMTGVQVDIYRNGVKAFTETTNSFGKYSRTIQITTLGSYTFKAKSGGVWSDSDSITIEARPEVPEEPSGGGPGEPPGEPEGPLPLSISRPVSTKGVLSP